MEQHNSHNLIPIKNENEYFLEENDELRKLWALLQENIELRNILKKTTEQIKETPLHATKGLNKIAEGTSEIKSVNAEACLLQAPSEVDLEKAVMHSPQNANQLQRLKRIVGEIAFQLDRRILGHVFQDAVKFYGMTVSNIPEKIKETGKNDIKKKEELIKRYQMIMEQIKKCGYDPSFHPRFSEYVINEYGLIKEHPSEGFQDMLNLCHPKNLQKIISASVPSMDIKDVLILLRCLSTLSAEDGKPMFVW